MSLPTNQQSLIPKSHRKSSAHTSVLTDSKGTNGTYQIPWYSVLTAGKFPRKPALYLAAVVAIVLLCTELALYLHPGISYSFALLLTVVCGTSALAGEYVSRLLRRAVKRGGAK